MVDLVLKALIVVVGAVLATWGNPVIRLVLRRIDATGRAVAYDQNIMNIINEEIQTFMNGTKTAEQTASLIQDRVSLYVNEQR